MNKIKYALLNIAFTCFVFGCNQAAKEADIDGDGKPDILVTNQKLKDLNERDNIFVYDGVVVNAVTNDQWRIENDQLAIVEHPNFKMKFDSKSNSWKKIDENP